MMPQEPEEEFPVVEYTPNGGWDLDFPARTILYTIVFHTGNNPLPHHMHSCAV